MSGYIVHVVKLMGFVSIPAHMHERDAFMKENGQSIRRFRVNLNSIRLFWVITLSAYPFQCVRSFLYPLFYQQRLKLTQTSI